MVAIPIIAAAGSAVMSQMSNMSGQEANANTLNYNANIAESQGKAAIAQGGVQAQIQQNKVDATIGTARADAGASGVTLDNGGSSAKVIAQDTQQGSLDVANINANAQRTAWGYDTQATLDRAQADAATKSSNMSKTFLDPLGTMFNNAFHTKLPGSFGATT
jgi:hypothetical protein